jgi:RNA polymerase sigma-70 factor (ECF subfamily)
MGIAGLALPWGTRISPVKRHQEKRVESSERLAGRKSGDGGAASQEDSALAAACRAGDLSAYERLFELHGARMKSLARHLLGTRDDAEDAVQETFLKIQRGISSFRGQSAFSTWAFRVLVNACYDLRRRRVRRQEVQDPAPQPGEAAVERPGPGAHPSLRLALERSLAQLPQRQREIFLLYEVEGFAHAEIAAMLNVSEAVSKNALFQAKRTLRKMLEPPRAAGRPE